MLREKINTLINELAKEVSNFYKDRLVSLVVFGSAAREVVRPNSDLDFLICAAPLPRGRRTRLKEFLTVENALTPLLEKLKEVKIFTALSPLIKTPEEVEFGSLLFLDMIDFSKILYDKNHFFKTYLENLCLKLKRLGSRKVPYGNRWYWELIPADKSKREVII